MDDYYFKKYGCVMPINTKKPNEKQCLPNDTMTEEYWDSIYKIAYNKYCKLPCSSMEVTFPTITKDKGTPDEAYVVFYFLNLVKVQTTYWSYTIISLLAEVGGNLGLLLGMSLLDITKVIDWLCFKLNIQS